MFFNFSKLYGIKCSCVNASFSAYLIFNYDMNLIIMPSQIILYWANCLKFHLRNDEFLNQWILQHVYHDFDLNIYLSNIMVHDKNYLKLKCVFNNNINNQKMLSCSFNTNIQHHDNVNEETQANFQKNFNKIWNKMNMYKWNTSKRK